MKWQEYPYHFEGLEKQLERILQKKAELDKLRPIPTYALKSIKESLMIEWTYNSNSIEGNTLTLQETKMVIEEGFTIKGKSLREHFEAVNHQEAIELVESLISDSYILKETDILNIHELVLQKIEKDFAGRFRTSGVRISGANFVPPNALKIDEYITELTDWTNTSDLNIVLKSAIFHHRFVWIHPFGNGNGRTVRLFTYAMLVKTGFNVNVGRIINPTAVFCSNRNDYYENLSKADLGTTEGILQWCEYVLKGLKEEIEKIENERKLNQE